MGAIHVLRHGRGCGGLLTFVAKVGGLFLECEVTLFY